MLICGDCRQRMRAGWRGNARLWTCPSCSTNAGTISTLRAYLTDDAWKSTWHSLRAAKDPSPRTCPACAGTMRLAPLSGVLGGITLDYCSRCLLVWFDRGEEESLPARPASGEQAPLPPDLARALALFIAEESKPKPVAVEINPAKVMRAVASEAGLPVEVQAPPLSRLPLATITISCVMVFLAVLPGVAAALALERGRTGLCLLAFPFAHDRFLTLIANVYLLWLFGDNAEEALGWWRMLALFFGAAFVAALFHLGFAPPGVSLAGATPVLCAFAAFYAIRFPRAKLSVIWIEMPAWAGVIVSAIAVAAIGLVFREFSVASLLGGALAGVAAVAPDLFRRLE